MKLHFLAISATGLFLASCVNIERAARPPSWSSGVPIKTLSDVTGTYRDAVEHTHRDDLNSLWYCLTRDRRTSPPASATVRLSSVANKLHATLLDSRGRVLDQQYVQRFRLRSGALLLSRASGATTDAFGSGAGTQSCAITRAANGDLVSQLDGTSAGLLFNVIPAVGFGTNWAYWPKTQ